MLGKRTISLLLVLALILAAAPLAYAAGTPTVSLSSGEANAGETVTLTVSIENNPGLMSCLIYFYYDTSLFSVDHDNDIVSAELFEIGTTVGNSIEIAEQRGMYYGKAGKTGALALWYDINGAGAKGDGDIIEITFKVAANAKPGTYRIDLDSAEADTFNVNGEAVSLNTSGGSVTVTGTAASGGVGEIQPEPEPEEPSEPEVPVFNDIAGHWAEAYIQRGAEIKLVDGKAPGKFDPDGIMTRAEMVTVLWRALGSPEPTKPASFTDLTQDWYKDAIAWAEENKVVDGVAEGKFAPSATVTREQVVTVLHRVLGTPVGMETLFYSTYDEQFTDSGAVSSWAKEAVYWAVYKGIYCGEDATYLEDKLAAGADATRAQIVVMIVRYLDKQ